LPLVCVVLNLNEQFFSYIRGDDARYVLLRHVWFDFFFIMLAPWNNSTRADMSIHSDTLSSFRANQSLLLFAMYLAAFTYFIVFGVIGPWLGSTFHRTGCEHTKHYTSAVICASSLFIKSVIYGQWEACRFKPFDPTPDLLSKETFDDIKRVTRSRRSKKDS
jgi:hypothetical protein